MDPNEALRQMRAAIALLRKGCDNESVEVATVEELLDHAEALDGWLKNGGFLPDDWKQKRAARKLTPSASAANPTMDF